MNYLYRNLTLLSRNSRKRVDKKSGRKKPRLNDLDPEIIPAPDYKIVSDSFANISDMNSTLNCSKVITSTPSHTPMNKTPKSILKSHATPKSKKALSFDLKANSDKLVSPIQKLPLGEDLKESFAKDFVRLETTSLDIASGTGNLINCDQPQNTIDLTEVDMDIDIEVDNRWVPGLGFTLNHKKSITNGEWLSSDHINAAMELLKKEIPQCSRVTRCGERAY